MATELAAIPQPPGTAEISDQDHQAAQAVATGLRDAKADNIR